MGDYEVRDNWGRKVGTVRPIGGGSGCLVFLGILCIALLVGGVVSCQVFSNLVHYHIFTTDTNSAQTDASATADAPYHYEEQASSAKISGNASVVNDPEYTSDPPVIQFGKGGSLTFDNIQEPKDGTYSLTVNAYIVGTADFIVGVIVNGKSQGELLLTGPGGPTDSSLDVTLKRGNNAIKLLNGGGGQCYENGNCVILDIKSIVIDKP